MQKQPEHILYGSLQQFVGHKLDQEVNAQPAVIVKAELNLNRNYIELISKFQDKNYKAYIIVFYHVYVYEVSIWTC